MKISQKNTKLAITNKRPTPDLKDVFNLLGNINRLRIFCALVKHGKIMAQDIHKLLNVSELTSHRQLLVLESNQILTKEKRGSRICYVLNQDNRSVQVARTALSSYYKW